MWPAGGILLTDGCFDNAFADSFWEPLILDVVGKGHEAAVATVSMVVDAVILS